MSTHCDVFWGTHGCHLPIGHDGTHTCLLDDVTGEKCCSAFYENGILMVIWHGLPRDPVPVPYGEDRRLFQWNEELQKFEDIEP